LSRLRRQPGGEWCKLRRSKAVKASALSVNSCRTLAGGTSGALLNGSRVSTLDRPSVRIDFFENPDVPTTGYETVRARSSSLDTSKCFAHILSLPRTRLPIRFAFLRHGAMQNDGSDRADRNCSPHVRQARTSPPNISQLAVPLSLPSPHVTIATFAAPDLCNGLLGAASCHRWRAFSAFPANCALSRLGPPHDQ
jgi:hypothetical protein